MSEAKIEGGNFKAVIAAVSRFPTIGTFVDSDKVNIVIANGVLQASTFGVVISRAEVPAEGEIELCGTDERTVVPYASAVVGQSPVLMVSDGKTIKLRTRNREIMLGSLVGRNNEIPKVKGATLKITDDVGKKLGYLSEIAMSDQSKPQLCAVMVSAEKLMAVNQKAVAVLDCKIPEHKGKTALPVPLLSQLKKGDVLTVGESTLLKSGIGLYCMPSPTAAQESFPVEAVEKLGKQKKDQIAGVVGDRLVSALEECSTCLGNVSRTEMVTTLNFKKGKMELIAQNGGVVFRRIVAVDISLEASLILPLEEALHSIPMIQGKDVRIFSGQNGEAFISFDDGWLMFPTWDGAK